MVYARAWLAGDIMHPISFGCSLPPGSFPLRAAKGNLLLDRLGIAARRTLSKKFDQGISKPVRTHQGLSEFIKDRKWEKRISG
jgi:hypothetical protein